MGDLLRYLILWRMHGKITLDRVNHLDYSIGWRAEWRVIARTHALQDGAWTVNFPSTPGRGPSAISPPR
jgi:hypothetical protein